MSGPCTYDNMVKLFQDKMAGGKFIFYSASGAPHKPRNLFVKLIDLKPFSFLPLASSKVQRFDGGLPVCQAPVIASWTKINRLQILTLAKFCQNPNNVCAVMSHPHPT